MKNYYINGIRNIHPLKERRDKNIQIFKLQGNKNPFIN